MRGPTRVVFMPIKDGDVIDISGMEHYSNIHEVGFKPGPARTRSGWLVLLVHEGQAIGSATSFPYQNQTITIPAKAAPKKLRGPRT